MTLLKCRSCNHLCGNEAIVCPNCGQQYPVNSTTIQCCMAVIGMAVLVFLLVSLCVLFSK